MSELDQLAAACRAAPDDDAPRLVWADAVGGERGELVVLQCDLARGDLPPAEVGRRRRRCDELLARHGAAWSELERYAKRVVFRRGFVESAEIPLVTYLAAHEAIHARAPLLASLRAIDLDATEDYSDANNPEVSGVDGKALVTELLAHPALPALRGLGIADTFVAYITGDTEWHYNQVSFVDELLEAIAPTAPTALLRHLRAFEIGHGGDGVTSRGLRALIDSRLLAGIERLALYATKMTPEHLGELLATMPALRALSPHWYMTQADLAPQLPGSLVELRTSNVDDDGLAILAQSRAAPSLERLAIGGGKLAHAEHFAQFPRLRALDLGTRSNPNDELEPDGILALAAAGMPNLRELRITNRLLPESALLIADAFGPHLDRLDCGHAGFEPAVVASLETLVAGEVITGPYRAVEQLLVADAGTREPWQHYGIVELAR